MSKSYSIPFQHVISGVLSPVALLAGAVTVRPRLYEILLGSSDTPNDFSGQFSIQRFTAPGTVLLGAGGTPGGTNIVPSPLDPIDPPSMCVGASGPFWISANGVASLVGGAGPFTITASVNDTLTFNANSGALVGTIVLTPGTGVTLATMFAEINTKLAALPLSGITASSVLYTYYGGATSTNLTISTATTGPTANLTVSGNAAATLGLSTNLITGQYKPTLTTLLMNWGQNQRATFRWVAAQNKELIIPAVAGNGLALMYPVASGGSSFMLDGSLEFEE